MSSVDAIECCNDCRASVAHRILAAVIEEGYRKEAATLKAVGAWLSEISIILNDGTEIWLKDSFEDDISSLNQGEMPTV